MRNRHARRITTAIVAALLPAMLATDGMAAAAKKGSPKAAPAVPPGACLAGTAVIENGKLCATNCNEYQWCGVNYCADGKLVQAPMLCWEPTGLCTPKC